MDVASRATLPHWRRVRTITYVDPWLPDPDDARIIMRALFELRAKLNEVGDDVTAIRRLLEEDDDGTGNDEELP
jgi:hypothetical protein